MLFNVAECGGKKVEVQFAHKETSNNGGLLLLREVENQIKATMKSIQLKVFKVAAQVTVLKSKIKIQLPTAFYSKLY
jgi:hypothetical protein